MKNSGESQIEKLLYHQTVTLILLILSSKILFPLPSLNYSHGKFEDPIRCISIQRAALRPSAIAQTTSD
jgi:hypothetical protein